MKLIVIILILISSSSTLFSAERTLEWSDYQGKFSWKSAGTKCEILGMRLPTIKEFRNAYTLKLTKSWEEKGDYYWTYYEHTRGFEDAYSVNMISGEHSLSYKYTYKHVRCVRYSN